MSVLKLKIDVSGTIGDAAWKEIRQFDQIQSADFGPSLAVVVDVTIRRMLRTRRVSGLGPKSGSRRRFWRNTPCHTIWSRNACLTRMWNSEHLL